MIVRQLMVVPPSLDMSNFVRKTQFLNLLWVVMETMHYHIAQTIKFSFEDNFVSHFFFFFFFFGGGGSE